MNRKIEDAEIEKQLKPYHPLMKQKARPIPNHLKVMSKKKKKQLN